MRKIFKNVKKIRAKKFKKKNPCKKFINKKNQGKNDQKMSKRPTKKKNQGQKGQKMSKKTKNFKNENQDK